MTEIVKLSPLLIALVGLTYGPPLCLQCAWALGNMAAASQATAAVLLAQGAVPALLDIVNDASRTPADAPLAYAGATCAWALANIVRGIGGPKAANVLLSCPEPRLEATVPRVLLARHTDANLLAETAWLLAYTLRWASPGSQKLACRAPISHSALAALEAAAAALDPALAAALAESREHWCSEPPVYPPTAESDARSARGAPLSASVAMDSAPLPACSGAQPSSPPRRGLPCAAPTIPDGGTGQVCPPVWPPTACCLRPSQRQPGRR